MSAPATLEEALRRLKKVEDERDAMHDALHQFFNKCAGCPVVLKTQGELYQYGDEK